MFTLLYADDTIVLAETERELQSALDAVHEYCNNMHLTVNTQKTKVMIFSRGKVRKYQNFIFESSILDVTYEYVYLGVNFNYNTSFIKANERHISRAKRAMFAIVTKSIFYYYRQIYCLNYLIELSYLLYCTKVKFMDITINVLRN